MEVLVQNNQGLTYSFMKLFNKIEQDGIRNSHFISHRNPQSYDLEIAFFTIFKNGCWAKIRTLGILMKMPLFFFSALMVFQVIVCFGGVINGLIFLVGSCQTCEANAANLATASTKRRFSDNFTIFVVYFDTVKKELKGSLRKNNLYRHIKKAQIFRKSLLPYCSSRAVCLIFWRISINTLLIFMGLL